MKSISLCLLTALSSTCLCMRADALETSTKGVEGPKAAISVLEIKIDQMTASLNAAIQAVNTKVTALQTQVTQMQGQLNSVITCGAQTAVFDGRKCVPVSNSSSSSSSAAASTTGSDSSGYTWQTSWGPCSAVSGGGKQSLQATCYSNATGAAVASTNCTTTPPSGTQSCNLITKTSLNCASTSWAAVNLYKAMASRCPDDSGMLYWDQQHTAGVSDATIKTNFTAGYNANCAAYGTTNWSTCNTKWLCNTGFSYVANSTQCQ